MQCSCDKDVYWSKLWKICGCYRSLSNENCRYKQQLGFKRLSNKSVDINSPIIYFWTYGPHCVFLMRQLAHLTGFKCAVCNFSAPIPQWPVLGRTVQVNPIYTILKYGDYYDFMDR